MYNTTHDYVGKVIYCELREKLKFDHTGKLYVLKPESFLEKKSSASLRYKQQQ